MPRITHTTRQSDEHNEMRKRHPSEMQFWCSSSLCLFTVWAFYLLSLRYHTSSKCLTSPLPHCNSFGIWSVWCVCTGLRWERLKTHMKFYQNYHLACDGVLEFWQLGRQTQWKNDFIHFQLKLSRCVQTLTFVGLHWKLRCVQFWLQCTALYVQPRDDCQR